MPKVLRLVVAVIAGFAVGSAVNMALVVLGGSVIPPPAGADVTTTAGLKASMHLLEPRHFLFPFLAHALGTFAGALVAARLAADKAAIAAGIVGVLFFLGGCAAALMLPAPAWFNAADLLLAYGPPAWLGYRLGARRRMAGTSTA